MAKSSKSPQRPKKSGNGSDVKVTAIIIALALLGLVIFSLFSKGKTKPAHKETTPVAAPAPIVKQTPKPWTPPPVPVVPRPVVVKKAAPGSAGRIAFILDDWGGSMRNCKYLKEIPDPLAVSILPELRHSEDIAKCAYLYNKVIMLHLPMEPYHNNDPYPVDYLIKTSMSLSKAEKILNEYLAKMPLVQGVNNHMGSKATEDMPLMKVILRRIKKKGLFFVDSMTAPKHSICAAVANELSLPFAQRDVFLDNINTKEEIVKQIVVLAQKARKKGYAIAIGHDRTLTLQVLEEQIPLLKEQGFDIVSIKDLLKNQ